MADKKNTSVRDFHKLFFVKERKELLGAGYINFWVIFVILFVTFLAIGFANGSLIYLGKKMKDPFVNWVDIKVQHAKNDKILEIRDNLNDARYLETYNINNVTGYYFGNLLLWDESGKGTYPTRYRTVELNDPLLGQILSGNNLTRGRSFYDTNDESLSELGVIIKESTLLSLGYDINSPFIDMAFKICDTLDKHGQVAIPVIAVVKSLPGLSDIITTQYFYKIRNFNYLTNIFNAGEDRKNLIFTTADSVTVYGVADSLYSILSNTGKTALVNVSVDSSSHTHGYIISIDVYPYVRTYAELNRIYDNIRSSGILDDLGYWIRLSDYESRKYRVDDVGRFDQLSVNFNSLDHVGNFARKLLDEYDIEIDTAQIRAKENYNFISKLTRIISLILIGFSILSVCLFISNILKRHLEKIRKNIGTLKAFGLSNSLLHRIYLQLIIQFVSVSIVISFVSAWLIGMVGGIRPVLLLTGDKLESGETYFELMDIWTLIAIVLILLISLIVITNTARKILKQTPGDLIYNR